jgi:hypothetical protein
MSEAPEQAVGAFQGLLESISGYMESNVTMMMMHRKAVSLVIVLCLMNLMQAILTGVAVMMILKEVR